MTETIPARSVTGRGFTIYDEFTDSKASRIRVQDSSAAFGPHVWIFADHAEPGMYLTRQDRIALAGLDPAELAAKLSPSPHLDMAQAEQVRDALDQFIREAKETAQAEGLAAAELDAMEHGIRGTYDEPPAPPPARTLTRDEETPP